MEVKRHIVILIGQQGNSDSNEKEGQKDIASSNHIIVQECKDSNSEIEIPETPKTLEDMGQATTNDLKELDPKTTEAPCLVYRSSLLTPKEKKEYVDLLS